MKKLVLLGTLSLMLAGLSAGCGYTTKTVLPQSISTIYVDTVKNQIMIQKTYAYEPGVEMEITNAIINRLHRDGNLKVVGTPEEADVVLEPILVGYEQEGVRFSRLERAQEFRLFIVLDLRLWKPTTGELLWREENFSGDTEYFVTPVRSLGRDEATREAIDRLARNVVDRIVEDW